jgi:hypothetical protein
MKDILHSDILYLRDNESIFGHMFISFLSMYCHSGIENMLRAAGLLEKHSSMDVLEFYSKVYMIRSSRGEVISEVPKKVRKLDVRLGLNIFPNKIMELRINIRFSLLFLHHTPACRAGPALLPQRFRFVLYQ